MSIRGYARRLVEEYPDKAVDILVRCCNTEIETEILKYLADVPPRKIAVEAAGTINTLNTRRSLNQALPSETDRFGPPAARRGPSDRTGSSGASISSHSRSLSSKDGRENIVILADGDQGDEHRAQMRFAQVALSVIAEHMFAEGRISDSYIRTIPEESIYVPRRGASGAFVNVSVTACATLTWQRPRSRTHSTLFYLVPDEMLVDIDILLGYKDSGEEPPGGIPSPTQKERGRSFGEAGLNPHPHPQAARGTNINHVPSYHRSSHLGEHSGDTSTGLPDEMLRRFFRQDQTPAEAGRDFNAPLPFRASPQSRTSQREQPASHPTASVPNPTTHPSNQTSHTDKIRLSCALDSSSFTVWLHPDAGVEAFLANVQREFERRNRPFDRAVTAILLKSDKAIPDGEAKYLSLGEDDMEADWEETMEWLLINKRKTPPHIYGVIRLDAE